MKNMKLFAILVFCAGFLSVQANSDFLSRNLLDVALGDDLIVVGSKAGINWKRGESWQGVKRVPFAAERDMIWDNIVAGSRGGFAVRLGVSSNNEAEFFIHNRISGFSNVVKIQFPQTKEIIGFDGFFDNENEKYYFAIGNGGIAVLSDGKFSVIESDFFVNSISNSFGAYDFIALSSDGKIYRSKGAGESLFLLEIGALELNPNEEALRFFPDFSRESILILTEVKEKHNDEYRILHNRLIRWSEGASSEIYRGDVFKAATTFEHIYILQNDGKFVVLNKNGERNDRHRDIILNRLRETNAADNFEKNNLCVLKKGTDDYALAFATTNGLFYSESRNSPFVVYPPSVNIASGLREVYAEPGIINMRSRFATFEYSLSENDRVTIDIFNYNMDFVVRIIDNEWRLKGAPRNNSTNRQFDRWDGTINNNGGRTAAPGVYFFRISTLNGRSAMGRVVVAK